MKLTRHAQVMKMVLRRFTSLYVSRRRTNTLEELREQCLSQGIEIDTFEHNRKLTINIKLIYYYEHRRTPVSRGHSS